MRFVITSIRHLHAVLISSNLLDFTLRSKISFAVRQISLRVLFCTRRGWAVGVAALRGYYTNSITANDVAQPRTITSAEVNKLEVGKSVTNHYPIFAIANRAEVSALEVHKPIANC